MGEDMGHNLISKSTSRLQFILDHSKHTSPIPFDYWKTNFTQESYVTNIVLPLFSTWKWLPYAFIFLYNNAMKLGGN